MSNSFQQKVLADLGLEEAKLTQQVLEPESRKVTGIFHQSTEQFRFSTASRALSIIGRATLSHPLDGIHALSSYSRAFALEGGNEPCDTEFLHDADPAIRSVTHNVLRGMMLKGSGIRNDVSIENFQRAMELNRNGEPVCFEMIPHMSELDPVFVETIIEDLGRSHEDPLVQRDAAEYLNKNIVLIGHKVFLSRIRRVFARTVRSLFTVAPKYRAGLSPEETSLLSAHSRSVGQIVKAVREHADYVLSLCPEGGRTVDRQIGVYKVGALGGGYRVPLFLDMPDGFLNLDAKNSDALKPAQVQLTVGAPFQPSRANDYPAQMHQSLSEAGAPVDRFAWGYKDPIRNAPNIDRRKGAPEVFTPTIERKEV